MYQRRQASPRSGSLRAAIRMNVPAGMRIGRIFGPANPSGPLLALAFLLVSAFLLGGGSQRDIESLIVLRPLSALLLAYGMHGLTMRHVREHAFLFAMAAAIMALVAIQLIPLPPAIWSALPGRALIVQIDHAAGLAAVWRPISLVPSATWNALFSLLTPAAALVLGVRMRREEWPQLVLVMLGIGISTAAIAILQLGGPKDGPLYFYDVTNGGDAVGLFANRNHQAFFLATLIPMLTAFAAFDRAGRSRLRLLIAVSLGGLLVPLILVTGSRAGMLLFIVALSGIPFIHRRLHGPGDRKTIILRTASGAAAISLVAGLALTTVLLGRAEAFDRLVDQPWTAELRYKAWAAAIGMAWGYFPVGAGFGAFREVFQIGEPRELLATTYFYHAHNDWLETFLDGSLPALLLLGAACLAFVRKFVGLIRSHRGLYSDQPLARAGCWIILLLSLGSISDYPLRVPSLACLFVVAAIWMSSFRPGRYRSETN